ncbi:MAG: class I SAM-dependent methyltransferase [Planctomycetota bacterium]
MKEASKTLRLLTPEERALLSGRGIDIGCGNDPILPSFTPFDKQHGDAEQITAHVDGVGAFDVVFSSHCLEHLVHPDKALAAWWSLLRPGGTLMVVVPDAELYEQGYWPSIFNSDHRWRCTIAHPPSTATATLDLRRALSALPNAHLVGLRIQDEGYRHERRATRHWPRWIAVPANRIRLRIARHAAFLLPLVDAGYALLRLPIDQTCRGATAQLLAIARKGTP